MDQQPASHGHGRGRGRGGRAVQVRGVHCKRGPTIKVELTTQGKGKSIGQLEAYPDSAADCSLVGFKHIKAIGLKPMKSNPFEEGIDAANKSPFTVLGKIRVGLRYCEKEVQEEIVIVKEDTLLLILWSTCIEWRILHKEYPAPLEARGVSNIFSRKPENRTLMDKFLSKAKDSKEPTRAEVGEIKSLS